MENSFYLTVSSNNYQFDSILPQDFNLSEKFVVGLVELTLPLTWMNIPTDEKVELIVYNPNKKDYFEIISTPEANIPRGHYTKVELEKKDEFCYFLFQR